MDRLIPVGKIAPKSALEVKSSQLGIGFEKLDRNVFDPEKAYDKVAALGVNWVRLQSGWQRTEREKGVYDFAWLDDIVDNLIRRGMVPWICLCYGNDLYTEAAKTFFGAVGCPPIFTEEERTAWHNYVKATTEHFKGRVEYYEVWNEPDGRGCWKHGVNAQEYGEFAAATAKALKRCGFDVMVAKSGTLMQTRCPESDKFGADIHMPIHTNAFNGKYTGGTRVFCLNSNGRKAAEAVKSALGAISPGKDDSVSYKTDLYEINVPKALTVYVECEFHDTVTGSDWIRKNTVAIGEAICKGMCNYFDVKYKTDSAGSDSLKAGSDKAFRRYIVRITSSNGVNIRKGPGTNYDVNGAVPKGGAYTIVDEKSGAGAAKWGKLKSGAGWIALDYTEKIR